MENFFFYFKDNQETVCKLDGKFFVQSLGQEDVFLFFWENIKFVYDNKWQRRFVSWKISFAFLTNLLIKK